MWFHMPNNQKLQLIYTFFNTRKSDDGVWHHIVCSMFGFATLTNILQLLRTGKEKEKVNRTCCHSVVYISVVGQNLCHSHHNLHLDPEEKGAIH